ncbi:MAG: NAD-dependent epimerase/dehydratase family protein [Bacteroidales bacterium]|jgi:dihydroflavonol-4-reductase
MKVAVTGASGHIGSCLLRELKKQGAGIKALVYDSGNGLDEMDVELIKGDLLEPESLIKLCEGVDVVFHLAAQIAIDNRSSAKVYETNVTGTKNIIKAANKAGSKKFIHFSSIHAFQIASPDQLIDESTSLVETNKIIYEFTKAEGEREVMNAVKEGLNAVILNPTAVIGPFDYRGSLLGQALLKIYKKKLPFLVSGGYNWVDVRDVVSASIQAIVSGRKGEKYILSGEFCSLRQLSVMISKISGRNTPVIVPVSLARMACPFIQVYSSLTKKEPLYTYQSLDILINSPVNISNIKAKKELGYEPRPLEKTLKDTFDWYRENNIIN